MWQLSFIFLVYCVLGWLLEVVYHIVTLGGFVNRGFLKGPYCPIYGFGMIFIVDLLHPYVDNPLLLFLASVVVTTLLELVVGAGLEIFLKKRWWDYSDEPLNFKGYICARFSLYWGVGALIAVKFIHPFVQWVYDETPPLIIKLVVVIVGTMMVIDFIATLADLLRLNKQLDKLEALRSKIEDLSISIGEKMESDSKRLQGVLEGYHREFELEKVNIASRYKRLLKAFPKARDKDNSSLTNLIKELRKQAEDNTNKEHK